MARAGLLLLPLLLCFGPETAGSIDPTALKKIVDYVTVKVKVKVQYAFAASLPQGTCRNPQDVSTYLPLDKLADMSRNISQDGGLYNSPNVNIVAARPRQMVNYTEHSEWRLLHGDQNSLVAQLKARTYGKNSCLILFTFNSPCSTKCLRNPGRDNIVQMTSDAFQHLDQNSKAFVFQQIFHYDLKDEVSCKDLLDAWHRLRGVPLLHCDKNSCKNCAAAEPQNNPCLAEKR